SSDLDDGVPPRGASDQAGRPESATARGPPVASLPGNRPPATRRFAPGDRRCPASSSPRHHTDLRQGGHRGPAGPCPAVAGGGIMTTLRQAVEEYLSLRRALGF